jgi:hypothetical protein
LFGFKIYHEETFVVIIFFHTIFLTIQYSLYAKTI